MSGAFGFIVAMVFLVIALNFYMLFIRMRRDRVKKPGRLALDEDEAAELRDKSIQRKLDHEEEQALEYIKKRNRTFELYEQVRREAAIKDIRSELAAEYFINEEDEED